MGDGFGKPQTTARVPTFAEVTQETSAAALTQSWQDDLPQLSDPLQNTEPLQTETDTHVQLSTSQAVTSHGSDTSITHNPIICIRQRRGIRRPSAPQADSSVRDRLFQLEGHHGECER